MAVVDWEYGLDTLRNKVVRVVFQKKGNGNFREMWATRNPDLIANYVGFDAVERLGGEDRTRLAQQKRNNNLVVFDVEIQDFRTIPLENIVAVDQFNGVPGWVEFNFTENWQGIMEGKVGIYDYLNYY